MILQECLQVFHPLSFFFKYVQSYQHNYSLKITRRTNKSVNVVGKIRIHNKSMFNGQIQSNILLLSYNNRIASQAPYDVAFVNPHVP